MSCKNCECHAIPIPLTANCNWHSYLRIHISLYEPFRFNFESISWFITELARHKLLTTKMRLISAWRNECFFVEHRRYSEIGRRFSAVGREVGVQLFCCQKWIETIMLNRVRCAIIHTLRTNDDTCTFALLRIHSSPAQTLNQHAQTHRRTRTEISKLPFVGFRCLERKCTGIKNRLFLSAMPDKFQSFSFASFAPWIEKIFLVSRSPSPRFYRAREIIS